MKTLESRVSSKRFIQDSLRRDRRINALVSAVPHSIYTLAFGLAYYLGRNGMFPEANTPFEYQALNFTVNLAGIAGAISLAKSCFYGYRSIRP